MDHSEEEWEGKDIYITLDDEFWSSNTLVKNNQCDEENVYRLVNEIRQEQNLPQFSIEAWKTGETNILTGNALYLTLKDVLPSSEWSDDLLQDICRSQAIINRCQWGINDLFRRILDFDETVTTTYKFMRFRVFRPSLTISLGDIDVHTWYRSVSSFYTNGYLYGLNDPNNISPHCYAEPIEMPNLECFDYIYNHWQATAFGQKQKEITKKGDADWEEILFLSSEKIYSMTNKIIDELLNAMSKDQSEKINLSEKGFQLTKYPVYSETTENSLLVCRVTLTKKIPPTSNTKESNAEKFLMIESHDTKKETDFLTTHNLEMICPLYVLHTNHYVQSENA